MSSVSEDRAKERNLTRIATKGVTQLFNAVAERQKLVDKKLEELQKTKQRSQRQRVVEDLKSNDFFANLHTRKPKVEVSFFEILDFKNLILLTCVSLDACPVMLGVSLSLVLFIRFKSRSDLRIFFLGCSCVGALSQTVESILLYLVRYFWRVVEH
jgi:hypothetical protein